MRKEQNLGGKMAALWGGRPGKGIGRRMFMNTVAVLLGKLGRPFCYRMVISIQVKLLDVRGHARAPIRKACTALP